MEAVPRVLIRLVDSNSSDEAGGPVWPLQIPTD